MPRPVVWQEGALREIAAIRQYIAQFNPAAAGRVFDSLFSAASSLAEFPDRGRPMKQGRRELLAIFPYSIVYRVHGDVVQILRVRHGARNPEG